MDGKLLINLVAAAILYAGISVLFCTGIRMIAGQLPTGRLDPQFTAVVQSLSGTHLAGPKPETPLGIQGNVGDSTGEKTEPRFEGSGK
ncbi:MAG TPA: hypothetical protein VK463_21095 [Desulfomonilaceae bacterium]|nr:hypothetical protein [Desulfomonilaceae bacterium]